MLRIGAQNGDMIAVTSALIKFFSEIWLIMADFLFCAVWSAIRSLLMPVLQVSDLGNHEASQKRRLLFSSMGDALRSLAIQVRTLHVARCPAALFADSTEIL
jgi:hypothetical protein